jgi:hypothetical protein
MSRKTKSIKDIKELLNLIAVKSSSNRYDEQIADETRKIRNLMVLLVLKNGANIEVVKKIVEGTI